ncbi:hypothetical protein [Streptomyces sp. C8S0]|uniref:hypothetical protein n=1 Tax=Streptomyces sp. C8S0 TaxID=2585716 RepID=UPI001D05B81A|nr:hypothetical protein [Streptomyces sp. C8S0]
MRHPLDDAVLARWHRLPQVRLHTVPGPVADEILRLVYGAADAALVARHPGVGRSRGSSWTPPASVFRSSSPTTTPT